MKNTDSSKVFTMKNTGTSKVFTIGLTGGIASGKTLVSDLFAALDVPVIDADVIARELVARGSVGLAAITAQFGLQVLDQNGELDRAKMRQVIFANESKKLLLEEILHPLIMTEAQKRLGRLAAPYAIYVIPLLVEKGLEARVDRVLLVDASEDMQVQRLVERDDCSQKQALGVLANQAARHQRLEAADDVIKNNSDIESVRQQVLLLHEKYRIMGRSKNR